MLCGNGLCDSAVVLKGLQNALVCIGQKVDALMNTRRVVHEQPRVNLQSVCVCVRRRHSSIQHHNHPLPRCVTPLSPVSPPWRTSLICLKPSWLVMGSPPLGMQCELSHTASGGTSAPHTAHHACFLPSPRSACRALSISTIRDKGEREALTFLRSTRWFMTNSARQ